MTDPEIIQALLAAIEKKPKRFSEWEQEFVSSVSGLRYLSDKQRAICRRVLSEKSATTKDKALSHKDEWDDAHACERCLDGIVVMQLPFTERDRGSISASILSCG